MSKGASVNMQNHDGFTPLILASQMGHLEVVKLLMEKYFADDTYENAFGCTSLILASQVVSYLDTHPQRAQQTQHAQHSITNI